MSGGTVRGDAPLPGGGAPVVVAATANAGKLAELRALLAPLPLRVAGLAEFAPVAFPDEGDDYGQNAEAKARAAARALALPALGDDSGLEVDALGGAPGPRSARYGGHGLADADRTALLLRELDARGGDRRARFVCVAALALPDGTVRTARGTCEGRIGAAPRGANGFGYDPVFEPDLPGERAGASGRAKSSSPYAGRTFAELGAAEKDHLSHRGRAVRALLPAIRELVLEGAPQASAAKRS